MPKRITIQVSNYEAIALAVWAKYHGRPIGTYAAQIVANRIETNIVNGTLDKLLAEMCRDLNVTEDELRAQLSGELNLDSDEDL